METPESLVLQKYFDETAPQRAALRPQDLYVINIDIAAAYMTVIGSLPAIRGIRAAIADELTRFDLAQLESVEHLACAMMQAHREYLAAVSPLPGLVELGDQASAARDRLGGVAQLLAKLGLINPARLSEVKGSIGYRNVGMDLLVLTDVLRDAWPTIEHKTPLDRAEIDAAESVGKRLMDAVGMRAQAPSATNGAVDERQRAYTLFARTYDEIRAAVVYVRRHEGDAETIAPSLYVGRGGRGKKSDTQPPVATPAAPTPATPAAPAAPHEAGMPGGSPFVTGSSKENEHEHQ